MLTKTAVVSALNTRIAHYAQDQPFAFGPGTPQWTQITGTRRTAAISAVQRYIASRPYDPSVDPDRHIVDAIGVRDECDALRRAYRSGELDLQWLNQNLGVAERVHVELPSPVG